MRMATYPAMLAAAVLAAGTVSGPGESPAGTYFLVPSGEKLFLHCYASNFMESTRMFHHAVRILYW